MATDTLSRWSATGPALLRFEPGVRDEDADSPATADFEDLASIHLEIPLRVAFHPAVFDGVGEVETTLFVGLEELRMDTLFDPVILEEVEEDSTVYLMNRHRLATVRGLELRPAGDGFSATLRCDVEFPDGVQRLQVDFVGELPS